MINPFDSIDARLSKIESLLLDIKHSPVQIKNDADQLLTIQEVAEVLSLSKPTVYGYVQRREIPFIKKKKRLYFSKSEILDWAKSGRKDTVAEITTSAQNNLKRKK